jgi:hypothetical protein
VVLPIAVLLQGTSAEEVIKQQQAQLSLGLLTTLKNR